jgi:hypothetical protein
MQAYVSRRERREEKRNIFNNCSSVRSLSSIAVNFGYNSVSTASNTEIMIVYFMPAPLYFLKIYILEIWCISFSSWFYSLISFINRHQPWQPPRILFSSLLFSLYFIYLYSDIFSLIFFPSLSSDLTLSVLNQSCWKILFRGNFKK